MPKYIKLCELKKGDHYHLLHDKTVKIVEFETDSQLIVVPIKLNNE